VLPDNRGLSTFYGCMAEALAEASVEACAIDYFGRTAGRDLPRSDFQPMEHLMRVTRRGLEADFAAAVDHLRSNRGGACTNVFALGFCFGGRQAFLSATLGHNLAGVIGFYGFPGTIFGAPGPTQRAPDIRSPVLAIWGGADEGIAPSEVSAFDEALAENGIGREMVTYPGAPHSFFDIHQTEFQDASADAWARTLRFISEHGQPPAQTS
jgi:carboxymethylenebutenolidase